MKISMQQGKSIATYKAQVPLNMMRMVAQFPIVRDQKEIKVTMMENQVMFPAQFSQVFATEIYY